MKISAPNRVAAALLALLPDHDWSALSLERIAQEAKVPPAIVRRHFKSLEDTIPAIIELIDGKAQSALPPPDPALTPRDRLFETLMTRFDVMEEWRPALLKLEPVCRRKPEASFLFFQAMQPTMKTALHYANGTKESPLSAGAASILMSLYGWVFYAWIRDKSPDKAATLARLDRATRLAETLGLLCRAIGTPTVHNN